MTESRRPALIILLIILSLILHTGFLILFFFFKPPENESIMPRISFEQPPLTSLINQEPPDPTGVASLKPRASQFGDLNNENAQAQETQPMPSGQQAPPDDDHDKQDEKKEDQSTDLKNEETQTADQTETQESSPLKLTGHDQAEQALLNAHDVQTSDAPKQKRKKRPQQKPRMRSEIYGADMQTRSVTFADIAQGFIHSLKNEGNDWLKRNGDDSKRPDPVEMRYISYIQKVVWYLQNSFNQTMPKAWPTHALSMSFKITLNKEGEIHHIELIQPSGNDQIDAFTRKRIERAAPFPPLPDHFKRNNFQIMLSFSIGDQRTPIIHGSIACQ